LGGFEVLQSIERSNVVASTFHEQTPDKRTAFRALTLSAFRDLTLNDSIRHQANAVFERRAGALQGIEYFLRDSDSQVFFSDHVT
jgi:hypothetical protein